MASNKSPKTTENGFDAEGDWMAHQFFSEADLEMSPEEYAARHGHLFGCFALDRYRFRYAVLGVWVGRLGQIFSSPNELAACQQRFLSPDELANLRKQVVAGF